MPTQETGDTETMSPAYQNLSEMIDLVCLESAG
jgi:hypothetical protein